MRRAAVGNCLPPGAPSGPRLLEFYRRVVVCERRRLAVNGAVWRDKGLGRITYDWGRMRIMLMNVE